MIKIVKKLRYYSEVLYNEETYKIENEVMYKYHLKDGSLISSDNFNKVLKDNDNYYYDRFAKNKLKKLLTKQELINYLKNEGANSNLINELMTKYEEFKYIDDNHYVKSYIDFKGSKEGLKLIKTKLLKKGIDEKIIDSHLKNINEEEKIINYINSNIKKYQNLNKFKLKNKIMTNLISKGFNYYDINNVIDSVLESAIIDEQSLILKDYQKMMKKYQNEPLKVKQKLYENGYSLTLIDEIMAKD